jgi:F-type Type IV secretion system, TraN
VDSGMTSAATTGGNTATLTGTGVNDSLYMVCNIAYYVSIAMAVYSVVKIIATLLFGCKKEDMITDSKRAFHLCSKIGTCSKGLFDWSKNNLYCCYASILSRIINEQGRPQIGLPWASSIPSDLECDTAIADAANVCNGFTPNQLSEVDFSKIDFSEYLRYLEQMTPTPVDTASLQKKFQNDFNNLQEQQGVTPPATPSCTPSSASVQPYSVSETLSLSAASSPMNVQQLTIADDCTNPLSFISSSDSAWVSFPASGTGAGTLTFNITGLAAGTYNGTLTITPEGYQAVQVPVYLTVTP